jgi:hypothetical protein
MLSLSTVFPRIVFLLLCEVLRSRHRLNLGIHSAGLSSVWIRMKGCITKWLHISVVLLSLIAGMNIIVWSMTRLT